MSEQQNVLTYERVLKMFRKTDRQMKRMSQETDQRIDRLIKGLAEQLKATQKEVGKLGSRLGEIIESMVGGDNIIEQFQKLGYHALDDYCENKKFGNKSLGIRGEIDLFIENGDIAILVEVKTTLETVDVRKHIEQMEKFRRCVDAKGIDQRRFIGAVAGAVIKGDAAEFAMENGLYVIAQSGEAFKIIPPPEGFTAKKW